MTSKDSSGIRSRTIVALAAAAAFAALAFVGSASMREGAVAVRAAGASEARSAGTQDLHMGAVRRAQTSADLSSAFIFRRGRFTPLRKVPGAAISQLSGINNLGQITGIYRGIEADPDAPGAIQGFVQHRRGDVANLELPYPYLHAVRGINDLGQIVGYYDNEGHTESKSFLRQPNGTINTFNVAGASSTSAWGINNRGRVVGNYERADATLHGFLRHPGGTITRIDVPGSSYTTPNDINDGGRVVGAYLDGDATIDPDGTVPRNAGHGFVWDKGRFARFDVPGSVFTQPFGINNQGQISGGYYDSAGKMHGFLLSNGRYTKLDAPGRASTIAVDVNDRGDVVIPDPNTLLGPIAPA